MLKLVWLTLGLGLLGVGAMLFFYGVPAPTHLIEKKIAHEKLAT